jgi:putative ABC transport system ATP-binding protein/lipoprotein-releasing system ATP-binding protein
LSQIELHDIKKDYLIGDNRIQAVVSVSLKIEKGEFVSIVGHSGSGKTSLLSIIGGILGPSSGRLAFEGTDVYSLSENALSEYRAERIGYVFQFASLLPVLTARENLLLPTLFRPGVHDGAEEKAVKYLEMVGLADKVNSHASQLSGGQQRRVAIARALMNDPDVILADEPTGDLDEETEADVMDIFRRVNRDNNITFVLVTHNTELAAEAGRRFRMTAGKIEELKS